MSRTIGERRACPCVGLFANMSFTLQTIPARTEKRDHGTLAKVAGFSLQYGVAAGAYQRCLSSNSCADIVSDRPWRPSACN